MAIKAVKDSEASSIKPETQALDSDGEVVNLKTKKAKL